MVIAAQYSYYEDNMQFFGYSYEGIHKGYELPKCFTSTPSCCTFCRTSTALSIAENVSKVYGIHDYAEYNPDMSVAEYTKEALIQCVSSKLTTLPTCTTYTVTKDDEVEITRKLAMIYKNIGEHERDSFFVHFEPNDVRPIDWTRHDEDRLYDPDTLLYALFLHDREDHTSNIMFRLMRNMRAGDVVVCANVRHDPTLERFIQKVGVARFLEMRQNNMDDVWTAMEADWTIDDVADKSTSVFMVLRPHRGWARVRHVLRVRAIVVYWLFLTEKLMGPGGSSRKRDWDAFEAGM